MAPVTFEVTYRLSAEVAAAVLEGASLEDGPAHRPAPGLGEWETGGMDDDEAEAIDEMVREALTAAMADDADLAAAVAAADAQAEVADG
jgi:hypothetical protein